MLTLSWSISAVLVGALVIPLELSSWQLVRQSQLNFAIRQLLAEDELLGREDIEVLETIVLWKPPQIKLVVRTKEPITPEQVGLVETAVQRRMGRPFAVAFDVMESQQVEATPLP